MENLLKTLASSPPNPLDLTVAAVFMICFFISIKKGLIRMAYNLVSFSLSFLLTRWLYPYVSVALRNTTGVYNFLTEKIATALPIEDIIPQILHWSGESSAPVQALPENILYELFRSNELHIYEALGVYSIEEYVSAFLANMVLNVISAVVVFTLAWVIMRLFATVLDIAAKLPVIRSFNKAGGAIVGIFIGFLVCWIVVNGYCIFYLSGPGSEQILKTSLAGRFFYENGLILKGFTYVYI